MKSDIKNNVGNENECKIQIDKLTSEIEKKRREIRSDALDLSIYLLNEFDKLDRTLENATRSNQNYILLKKNTQDRLRLINF